ncbi:integrase catalytic domain-containing protein [Trichonephila clavipes]|nr:integrase catalytic domain-containing protein [Trichonephila clavipes]
MRCIGQGLESLKTFCAVTSLPNPVEQKSHDVINNKLSLVMKEVAEESMKRAAIEENSSSPDNLLMVSGDVTWKTRGHSSLIGVCRNSKMFKNCRKEELRIVALELGDTVAEKVTIVELNKIIKENKYFKEDVEFAKELIQYTNEDRKRAEEDRKKEAENRLREKELELELARLNARVNSDNERTGEGCNSLDALVKSVRILTVKVPNRSKDAKGKEHCGFIQAADNLEHLIKKFWEIENVEIDSVKTSELDIGEDHFKNTHSRDDQGRYTVVMPLKEDPSCLGESRQTEIQRLNSLWKRLSRDKEYLSLYEKFLQEYEDLGHMREIKADGSGVSFYMPHDGVYRPEKSTTKLRTVFNASSQFNLMHQDPSTSGKSLNSIQFNGGLVQEDLFSIMVHFENTSMPLLQL